MIEKRLNNEFIRFGRALRKNLFLSFSSKKNFLSAIKRKNEFIRFGRRKRSTDESNSGLNLAPESNSALSLAPEHVEEKRMNDFIRFGKRMNMLVSMRYGKGSMQHGKQNRSMNFFRLNMLVSMWYGKRSDNFAVLDFYPPKKITILLP